MSKSNDSSFTVDLGGDATCIGRALRDDELEKVSGGGLTIDGVEEAQLVSRARFSGIATSEIFELNA